MLDRRTFLKSAGALATLPLLSRAAGGLPADDPAARAGPKRGLLFDAEDIPRIRENLDSPRFAELRADVFPADLGSLERFLRDEIKLTDHLVDMARARTILEHAALAFALTRDGRQLALARLALRRLGEYERWDYFLEGGKDTIGLQRAAEASIACCLALDWLGDELTAEERAAVEHQVAAKGAPACYLALYGMKYPDRVRGWTQNPAENFPFEIDMRRWPVILNATNLKVIPICGLGFAAIALHGRHVEAAKWLEMARQSARAFATMYGLDGSYDEGVGYWGYTTMHLILFAEALHRRLGIDERNLVNYPGTVRYALSMAMPTLGEPVVNPNEKPEYNATPKGMLDPRKDLVNFGDSGTGMDVSIAPWVARTHHDPLSSHVARGTGGMKQLGAVIWHDATAPAQAPGPELHDVRMANDLVISRTGWAAEDTVVALRSGGPSNHEHADRNSVIFKAHGERLFHDSFKAAYIPSSPRWLLRQTEAHTAVLIGGKGHQYHDGSEGTNSSWASARVTAYRTGNGWMTVTSDATDAYQLVLPEVTRVERTLVFLKPDILLLLDRVQATKAFPVQLRFQVCNEDGRGRAEATGTSFTITRPHATLAASVHASGAVDAAVGRLALPDFEGSHPYVEVTSVAALSHEMLTVTTAQKAGGAHGALTVTREGAGWRVRGAHHGRAVDVLVVVSADGPPVVTV
jgi:hypothetical protein